MTNYTTKEQHKTQNMSAILAKGYAYHLQYSTYLDSLRDNQRVLLFRLVNTINREQELSGPMVISYLMGWGDVYRSHHYTPIYWSTFVALLLTSYPQLQSTRCAGLNALWVSINSCWCSATNSELGASGENVQGENAGNHDLESQDEQVRCT